METSVDDHDIKYSITLCKTEFWSGMRVECIPSAFVRMRARCVGSAGMKQNENCRVFSVLALFLLAWGCTSENGLSRVVPDVIADPAIDFGTWYEGDVAVAGFGITA